MSLVSWAKKEVAQLRFHKPKRLQAPPTGLDSVKSQQMLPVQEVVLLADLQCTKCQTSVADVISQMGGMESIVVHVIDKKVTVTPMSE